MNIDTQKSTPYKHRITGHSHCRVPFLTLSIAALSTALFYVLGAIPEQLIWHQTEGQMPWQWLTAHISHISNEHLLWNVGALLILGSIIEQTSRRLLSGALIVGVLGVNLYLALFYNLTAYAGLSGALNSVLMIALYCLYQSQDYRAAALITLALSIMKIAVESIMQESLFSHLPWPPVPLAHLAGLLGGAILVVLLEARKRQLLQSDIVNFEYITPKR